MTIGFAFPPSARCVFAVRALGWGNPGKYISVRVVRMSSTTGTRRILVPVANGSEEIETSAAVDTFRRAGADVTLASVEDSLTVTMSRGMKFVADDSIDSVKGPFDAVALPGTGSNNQ